MSALIAKFEQDELPVLAIGASEAYGDSLKPIRRYFVEQIGDPCVDSVQTRHIKDFLSWRRVHRLRGSTPLSNRTLQKDRAVLHRMFGLADRLEWRDGNPVGRTDSPKADPRDPIILGEAQYDALLAACAGRPMLALYVLTLGEAGVRCESEALRLAWEDVQLDEGFVWIAQRDGHRTKSGKGRYVPMTPRLSVAMREHFARYRFAQYDGQRTPWVFHHGLTRRHHAAGDRIKSLHSGFHAAAQRAKLPAEFHQHDLRHRRVTTWLAEGKSAALVKEAMGHSDLRVTMGYSHLSKEHLRALVAPTVGVQRRDAVKEAAG
jgi:integrase